MLRALGSRSFKHPSFFPVQDVDLPRPLTLLGKALGDKVAEHLYSDKPRSLDMDRLDPHVYLPLFNITPAAARCSSPHI